MSEALDHARAERSRNLAGNGGQPDMEELQVISDFYDLMLRLIHHTAT